MLTSKLTLLDAWLVLQLVPGLGAYRLRQLVADGHSPLELVQANPAELHRLGFTHKQISAIKQPNWKLIARQREWVDQPNKQILTLNDPHYPRLLAETPDPPPVLFTQGDITLLAQPQLAMVGSRHPSPNGIEWAVRFAQELVNAGLIVTSGLALGIDGASHRGALQAGGKTIAVLGCGLNNIYPCQHSKLAEQIIQQQGLLVSEFAPDLPPFAKNFPQRNRIISGLSLGVLVVEANLRSGSLITARLAAEYGRDVFALPGAISHHLAQGCHTLLKQGAILVTEINDIILHLTPLLNFCLSVKSAAIDTMQREAEGITTSNSETRLATAGHLVAKAERLPVTRHNHPVLDHQQYKLLECVDFSLTGIEQIVMRSGYTVQQVRSQLSCLELAGYIVGVSGGYLRLDLRLK